MLLDHQSGPKLCVSPLWPSRSYQLLPVDFLSKIPRKVEKTLELRRWNDLFSCLRLALGGRQQRSRGQSENTACRRVTLSRSHLSVASVHPWTTLSLFCGCCEPQDDLCVVISIKKKWTQYLVGQQKQDMEERTEGTSDHRQTAQSNLFLVQT